MKAFIFFTVMLVSSLRSLSQDVIPLIPIINLQTQGAIAQKELQPFQLSQEYYQIFKELNITDTVLVEKLFKQNANISKDNLFYPLFKYKVLLSLAKQIMLSEEQVDIDCAKRILSKFANTFVGTSYPAFGPSVTCDVSKSTELRAKVSILNSSYFKFSKYEPIERLSFNTVRSPKNKKIKKITSNPCLGGHNFRTDMNISLFNSQPGGNGQSAYFTLVENGYIKPSNSNLRTSFAFTTNPSIKDISFYKNIALSLPTTNIILHAQKDISILFDSTTPSRIVDGISKDSKINKIFFFHNNCKLGSVYQEYEALLEAIVSTPKGGILLLEFGAGTGDSFPAEKEPILYELIHLATKLKKIIVIEPAGNLNQDIGVIPYVPEYTPDKTCSVDTDSGAIIVGGAEANNTSDITGIYRRVANSYCGKSNYGNRIDCYAQGEFVNTNYGNHSSTSSASAIIAGIAIDIQSIAKAKYGRFLTPTQMRYLLSRPSSIKVKQFGFDDKYIPVITESLLLELDRFFLNCPPNCPPEK